jgi:hypothetical protein
VALLTAAVAQAPATSDNMDAGVQEFAITDPNPESIKVLQLTHSLKVEDGTTVARFYFVDPKGKTNRGVPNIGRAFMKYDCTGGTFVLTAVVMVFDANNTALSILKVPPNVLPFNAKDEPALAKMWGFNEFCHVADSAPPLHRSGNWTEVVLPLLTEPLSADTTRVPTAVQAQPH